MGHMSERERVESFLLVGFGLRNTRNGLAGVVGRMEVRTCVVIFFLSSFGLCISIPSQQSSAYELFFYSRMGRMAWEIVSLGRT